METEFYTRTSETQRLDCNGESGLDLTDLLAVWGDEPTVETVVAWDGSLSPVLRLPVAMPGTQEAGTPLPPECTASPVDLRRNSPLRPVDWRWQLACRLVAEGRCHRFVDSFLYQAVRFRWALLFWKGERGETDRLEAAPELAVAHEIYSRRADPFRWELEARLLADEMLDSIAEKLSITPAAVRWYEALFFNVHDRLKAAGYITHRVIGLHENGGPKPTELDKLWKLYGYWGGPSVLDELINDVPKLPKPATAEEMQQFFREDIRSLVGRRAVLAVRTMPLDDPKVARKLIRLWVQMQQIEDRQPPLSQINIHQNIAVFLQQFAVAQAPDRWPELLAGRTPDRGNGQVTGNPSRSPIESQIPPAINRESLQSGPTNQS